MRSMLEEGAVVTKSNVGRYLVGFPRAGFDQLAARLAETLARDPASVTMHRRVVERRWFAASRQVMLDRAGRILIPQTLRDHALLESEVVIAGVNDHFQIWDASLYDAEDVRAEALIPELIQHVPELTY
jgi:MraZ protein